MNTIIVNPFEQYAELEEHINSKPQQVLPTFSPALNRQFIGGGIEISNVMLVGAKYGVGKTFFILNWILDLIRNQYKTVFFSLDMDFQKVFSRILRLILGLGKLEAIATWKSDKEFVKDKLTRAGYFDYLKIYTNEKRPISFNEITYICNNEKPNIVFIDHFSKIYGSGHNVYQETRQIAEYLRQAKKTMNTIFIVLMQLKKNDNHRKAPNAIPPGKDEFKGAGEIGEDADIMLSLARPDLDEECQMDRHRMIVGALRKNRLNDEPDLSYLFWKYDPVTTALTDVGLHRS